MIKRVFVYLVMAFGLFACSTLPSPKQEEAADYGPYPNDYETIAKNYLKTELRDPATIQFGEVSKPEKKWIGDKFTGVKYGYLVCVQVNSKNLLGKMTGFRSDAVLIRDGVVIDYVDEGELFSGMKLCN
uniref:hypothetical protein n=1 Tax=Ningiella ruwaisensis TaxID=2364274 RepID=UPI00109FB0F3|nr:hypothetical protein [Ningiella ruwaisensis]